MKTFHQAIEISKHIDFHMSTERVKLADAYLRVLCEDIVSDINMPPFDKSAMDGFACRKADLKHPLKVLGTIHAGNSSMFKVEPGTCVKIMTGAPVPIGADTVIMFEHTELLDDNHIQFTKSTTKSNICKLGEDVRTGDILMHRGTLLLPHHLAVLASAGFSYIVVSKLPRIALLATGDELVEPHVLPEPSQIRNSNAYNLMAQLKAMGIEVYYGGIVPDNKKIIHSRLMKLLDDHDLIILTGGASEGEHDHVPAVLNELGFEIIYNKIAIQPGKPVSFAATQKKFCFGLSGNPVSSFLQFELVVKPFLYHIMSHNYQHPIVLSEIAGSIERKNADRLKFIPVCFNSHGQAEEVRFNGSAHIAGLTEADGFALFPKECKVLVSGDKIEVLLIR